VIVYTSWLFAAAISIVVASGSLDEAVQYFLRFGIVFSKRFDMSKGKLLLSLELCKLSIIFLLFEKSLSFSLDSMLLAHSDNSFVFFVNLDNLVFVNCEANSFESFLLHKHL